jgi:putative colanic acid biosynthesis UDP-glucose lipid carrier transferase
VAASWATSIYQDTYIYSFEKFSRRTMTAYVYLLALEMIYLFFNKDAQISRLFLLSILSSFAISLLINRFLHLAMQQFFQSKDHIVRKVMIIGYNERAKKLAGYLEQEPIKTEIVGFCEEEENVNELSLYPIVGGIGDAIEASKLHEVTEYFLPLPPNNNRVYTNLSMMLTRPVSGFV